MPEPEWLKNYTGNDPRCINCEQPLWAPTSREKGLCSKCRMDLLGESPNERSEAAPASAPEQG